MYVLGYSGLNNSRQFRENYFDDLTPAEVQMCQGMDSSACLIKDGQVIAAVAEERFTGEKFTCAFPIESIKYCLSKGGINLDDVDVIAHNFHYDRYQQIYQSSDFAKAFFEQILSKEAQIKLFEKHFDANNIAAKFESTDHHLSHAALAYYTGSQESALVLVADGLGEMYSISVYEADEGQLNLLKNYNLNSSLGVLYSQVAVHLGFWPNSDEYKVMGLAPYGRGTQYTQLIDELITFGEEGHITINPFMHNETLLDKQTGRGFRQWLEQQSFPARKEGEPIEQKHMDLAYVIQGALEKALLHILQYWKDQTGKRNLCYAGGVALNCTANGEIVQQGLFDHIYIPPAADDCGTAIGAAIVHYQQHTNTNGHVTNFNMPFTGPEYSNEEILVTLEHYKAEIDYQLLNEDELYQKAASYVCNDKIIAWMQGRMEFGQRALGNRSLIANPRNPKMKDIVNKLVKKREEFRPFAPSVKVESASKYFCVEDHQAFPHMLVTVPVADEFRARLPAITHVNGSARIQTVSKDENPRYWKLLDAVEFQSDYPIVLNTSFNVKGQPIVRSPEQAIGTILNTNIDALFIGNYLVTKKQNQREF